MPFRKMIPMLTAAGVGVVGGIIAIVSVLVVFPPVIFAPGDARVTLDSLWGVFIGFGLLLVGFLVEIVLAVGLLVKAVEFRRVRALAQNSPAGL
jgi:hypothetical protein